MEIFLYTAGVSSTLFQLWLVIISKRGLINQTAGRSATNWRVKWLILLQHLAA